MNKYDLFSFTARIYYDYIKTLENRVSTFMIQHQCEKTDLYKANLMYMALDLDTGSHSIVLKYHTPLLTAGAWISVISALLYAGWAYFLEFKRKKIKQRNKTSE